MREGVSVTGSPLGGAAVDLTSDGEGRGERGSLSHKVTAGRRCCRPDLRRRGEG